MLDSSPPSPNFSSVTVPHITADMEMGRILELLPGGRRALFARYHLGGCQSCGFPPEETLASLCERNGNIPPDELIAHLLESHAHDEAMLISPTELQELLRSPAPPLLLDTRTREEHEAVSIGSSQFMTQELQQKLFGADPAAAIVLYDHSGRNVLDTCAWFQGHGLKNTKALRGGIDAWSREIDPSLPRYRIEVE